MIQEILAKRSWRNPFANLSDTFRCLSERFFAASRHSQVATFLHVARDNPDRQKAWEFFCGDGAVSTFGNASYCNRATNGDIAHYLRVLDDAVFVVAPRGVGIDTCRLHETWLLGSVPIVVHDENLPLVRSIGLPAFVIENWRSAMTRSELFKRLQNFLNQDERAFTGVGWQMLFLAYWRDLVLRGAKRPFGSNEFGGVRYTEQWQYSEK